MIATLDLDAIAALCASDRADPGALAEHVPALLAMARRTEQAERDLGAAAVREAELRAICDHLMKALRLAETASDGYRDLHAAWQRWAARLAPDAVGDEAKREAIEAVLRAIVAHRAALTGLLEHAEQRLADADRPHKVERPLCAACKEATEP